MTLKFHGMPHPGLAAHVLVGDRLVEKRITGAEPAGPVFETPCLPPKFLAGAPPRRTQAVALTFEDGTAAMAEVTL